MGDRLQLARTTARNVLLLLCVAAAGIPGQNTDSDRTRRISVDTEYGTLRFHGFIDRIEQESALVFRVRLRLTFDKQGSVNRTGRIDLTSMMLVASRRRADGKDGFDVLHRVGHPIAAHLLQDGDSAELPEIELTVEKSRIAEATHLGLSVTDGHLLWPISVELR